MTLQLAVSGGQAVRTVPVPPWPWYAKDEIDAVASVLMSGKVNQWTGNFVRQFQDEFAALFGQDEAIAVANGSLALEYALRALGVGPGDEVIVPARSFIASASCVSLTGAKPVFADIDLNTQNITPDTIRPHLTARTRCIVAVHLNGRPCDMPAIMKLAEAHKIYVIEDCAQSVGAKIGNRLVGTFGDAAAFSFCQDKIVSTGGEGGMIMLRDRVASRKAWSFKDHGKSYDLAMQPPQSSGYRWMHESIGSNGRMTEMQAAIGLTQLRKLAGWIERRNVNANRLERALLKYPCVKSPAVPSNQLHARYRLEFTVDANQMEPGWDRDRILTALTAEGIAASVGTCPEIYLEKAFAQHPAYPRLPSAQRVGETSLVLLTHPTIDERYLTDCEVAIHKVFTEACA
jgi:dTDP-4-amino-4,6-dideoxygalactose transaminase